MVPDSCCIASNAQAGVQSFAENRSEPPASAVGKAVSYCCARPSGENELRDATSRSWSRNGFLREGRTGKWNKVMESPRQIISPISDKPLGFQGIPD